jgi:hypothetical protein
MVDLAEAVWWVPPKVRTVHLLSFVSNPYDAPVLPDAGGAPACSPQPARIDNNSRVTEPQTQTPVQPARLWKQMPEAKRLLAAEAFWKEREGVEQQLEAMTLIARQLKARPKFVQGLPLERKARYLVTFPHMPDALAARLLVSYHLAQQRPMLKAFLDALGIAHEEGLITSDPEGPITAERLAAAADALDAAFPPEDVTLYLGTLLSQDPDTWGALSDVPQTARGRE